MSPKHCVLALLLLISLESTHTVMYELIDESDEDPGGNEYAIDYKSYVIHNATQFVWNTFDQKEGEGKKYDRVTLLIESFTEGPHAVASTEDNLIRLNADYLQRYKGDIEEEVTGVVFHEMTLVWQWTGNGMAPGGLLNGIADYVRLKGRYASKGWPRKGSGSRWDDGYAVTAYFLDYCNDLKHGFVAELNALMKDSYSEAFFVWLLGKSVHELWRDYKFAYGARRISSSQEGHRKPDMPTSPFNNYNQLKREDVPKNITYSKIPDIMNTTCTWSPPESQSKLTIFNKMTLQREQKTWLRIWGNCKRVGSCLLATVSTMIGKISTPPPYINSRKLDMNWQRTEGRKSKSEIDKPMTNW